MGHRVIDADGHICEPKALWNDYIPKQHRERTIRVEADEVGRMPRMRELGLDTRIFWGADYPHYDCTYPGAVTDLEAHLEPLGADLADKVRWRNAAAFLGHG